MIEVGRVCEDRIVRCVSWGRGVIKGYGKRYRGMYEHEGGARELKQIFIFKVWKRHVYKQYIILLSLPCIVYQC